LYRKKTYDHIEKGLVVKVMDYKDLLTIVLSSSVISAFVSKIFDFLDKRQEEKRVTNERQYNDKKEER